MYTNKQILTLTFGSLCYAQSIPSKFCKENLPAHELKMILEDERGLEYRVNSIGHRGLSGGWKAFALAHNLETGDALIFELRKPARFKV